MKGITKGENPIKLIYVDCCTIQESYQKSLNCILKIDELYNTFKKKLSFFFLNKFHRPTGPEPGNLELFLLFSNRIIKTFSNRIQ
jgi:hypothetical protein